MATTKKKTTSKKASKATTKDEVKDVQITAPNLRRVTFKIRGLSPYVQHKFSEKARKEIREKQEAGAQAKSRKKREPKDFDALYKQAMHVSEDGWIGIPAAAFRNAMIDACRLVGFKMTHMKMSVAIVEDGFDADEGTPLVKIEGTPHKHESYVRIQGTTCDVTVRPMWRRWSANLTVQWDLDQFSETDVANLLLRAGMQVGVGEGRPFSKNSGGMGWGTFTLVEDAA